MQPSFLELWETSFSGKDYTTFKELSMEQVGYAITLSPELKCGKDVSGIQK
mgnify:FL=1